MAGLKVDDNRISNIASDMKISEDFTFSFQVQIVPDSMFTQILQINYDFSSDLNEINSAEGLMHEFIFVEQQRVHVQIPLPDTDNPTENELKRSSEYDSNPRMLDCQTGSLSNVNDK